jgi:hypothetical protein
MIPKNRQRFTYRETPFKRKIYHGHGEVNTRERDHKAEQNTDEGRENDNSWSMVISRRRKAVQLGRTRQDSDKRIRDDFLRNRRR